MRHWSNGRFGSSVAVAEDRRVVQRHNEDPDAELRQPITDRTRGGCYGSF